MVQPAVFTNTNHHQPLMKRASMDGSLSDRERKPEAPLFAYAGGVEAQEGPPKPSFFEGFP